MPNLWRFLGALPEYAFSTDGAGILECDVTFTRDHELVCRHAQDDLHRTTNILATPLAEKCSEPFVPASRTGDASAECRASDVTLAEFKALTGKMDGVNERGASVTEFMDGTARWRTDLYVSVTGGDEERIETRGNVYLFEEVLAGRFDSVAVDLDVIGEVGAGPDDCLLELARHAA